MICSACITSSGGPVSKSWSPIFAQLSVVLFKLFSGNFKFFFASSGKTLRETGIPKHFVGARMVLCHYVSVGSTVTLLFGKRQKSLLFVFVHHALNDRVVIITSPWRHWDIEMILILLDRGRFVASLMINKDKPRWLVTLYMLNIKCEMQGVLVLGLRTWVVAALSNSTFQLTRMNSRGLV